MSTLRPRQSKQQPNEKKRTTYTLRLMFYFMNKTEDLSLRHSILALRGCSKEANGEARILQEFLQQRAGSRNIKILLLVKENQTSQVKEFSAFVVVVVVVTFTIRKRFIYLFIVVTFTIRKRFFIFIFEFFNFIFLYSRFLLVIHFIQISVYMSIPISQFITPPPPSPLSPLGVHTFVLYICVSNSALKPVNLYHFSRFHTYALIYDICFSPSDLLHSV